MFVQRGTGSIQAWFVAFECEPWFVPGRFKHIRAYGYCAEARTWVLIDPHYKVMDVTLVPEHEGEAAITAFTRQAIVVLRVDARRRPYPNVRLLGCCTSSIRDLLGLPGYGLLSAIPDKLYRDCIRAGATVCVDNRAPGGNSGCFRGVMQFLPPHLWSEKLHGRRWWGWWRAASGG